MRDSWTDERLDDLRDGMVDFRRETKEEFAVVRQEMREEFRAVRREMKEEFAGVRREMKQGFDALQRMTIQFQTLMIVALIGLIATQL